MSYNNNNSISKWKIIIVERIKIPYNNKIWNLPYVVNSSCRSLCVIL